VPVLCKSPPLDGVLHTAVCVSVITFPRYLQYPLMDFCQAFVIGASWNKDELIRFRGQRGKGQGHYCGRGVYDSKATFEFSFLGWMPLLSLNRSTEPFFSDAVYTSDQSKKAKELVCKLCLLSSVKFTC